MRIAAPLALFATVAWIAAANAQSIPADDLAGVWEGPSDITVQTSASGVSISGQLQWTGSYDAATGQLTVTAHPKAEQMCCTDIPLDIRKKMEGSLTVKLVLTASKDGETLKLGGKLYKGKIDKQLGPNNQLIDAKVGEGDGDSEDIVYTKAGLCDSLYPRGGTTTSRSPYKPWVKELLCKYIKADFTGEAARTAIVNDMITALQAHAAEAAVNAAATIVHVVTRQPVGCPSQKPITGAAADRSSREANKAAIGLNESLFKTPKATTREEADKRLPDAETAVLAVFALKLVADEMNRNTGAIDGNALTTKVGSAIGSFTAQFVNQATKPTFTFKDVPKDEGTAPPAGPTPDDAHNLKEIVPKADAKPISIKDVKGALGVTKSSAKTKTTVAGPGAQDRSNLESIEPKDVCGTSNFVVRVIVQTNLVIASETANPDKKIVAADGSDCTGAISKHEQRHAKDIGDAWDSEVIEGLRAGLAAHNEPDAIDMTVKVTRRKAGDGVWTDVSADYVFPSNTKASKAKAALLAFGTGLRTSVVAKFEDSVPRKADKFHQDVEDSLDDNCKPAKGGQGKYKLGQDAQKPQVSGN